MNWFTKIMVAMLWVCYCASANGEETDILDEAATRPLGVTVDGRTPAWGDPTLESAVGRLKDIPRPWTPTKMIALYEEGSRSFLKKLQHQIDIHSPEVWPGFDKDLQRCADLARVLAASMDTRATVALGRTIETKGATWRTDAIVALFDYHVKDEFYGVPESERPKGPFAGNALDWMVPATERWWADHKMSLKKEASEMK